MTETKKDDHERLRSNTEANKISRFNLFDDIKKECEDDLEIDFENYQLRRRASSNLKELCRIIENQKKGLT